MSSKCVVEVFLSDLGDKVVITEIIYYLLHVVIIGKGGGDESKAVLTLGECYCWLRSHRANKQAVAYAWVGV